MPVFDHGVVRLDLLERKVQFAQFWSFTSVPSASSSRLSGIFLYLWFCILAVLNFFQIHKNAVSWYLYNHTSQSFVISVFLIRWFSATWHTRALPSSGNLRVGKGDNTVSISLAATNNQMQSQVLQVLVCFLLFATPLCTVNVLSRGTRDLVQHVEKSQLKLEGTTHILKLRAGI